MSAAPEAGAPVIPDIGMPFAAGCPFATCSAAGASPGIR
jgi:hypothetical protein